MAVDPKRLAGEEAVKLVEDGMLVGLGTGSTAYWAIVDIGRRVKEGLKITAVPTSIRSEELAVSLGIPLVPLDDVPPGGIDLTIDGADEADGELNLIKGGGGALLREKIIAAHSKRLVIVADASKEVETLGTFPLPVEIVPFGFKLTMGRLEALGGHPSLRLIQGEEPYVTDNGNYIADCRFGVIADAAALETTLNLLPGVVENGLFVGMAERLILGREDGTLSVRARSAQSG
ncbi:ribose-5-phosphate isomerase RpiA [Cohnella rhizosphaerae]|uniref:Ribose-5-phosphate isomerase A n=1 Tax=Cohnella rhizosphaerae TaxID=1457232 RepID=A0A9X4KVZ2_9BACL|nr:ribose-5-phosphate isomerase RpiA [Cohnella rhizosphaerae]MDG0811937.1 ribose-5-phosphate isomerase RpiA [Cohnella rhizosphaerae]